MTVIWKGSVQNFWGEYTDEQVGKDDAGVVDVKKVLRSMDHNPNVMMGIITELPFVDANVQTDGDGSYLVTVRGKNERHDKVLDRDGVIKFARRVWMDEQSI